MRRGLVACALGALVFAGLPTSASAGTVAEAKAATVGSQVTITGTITTTTDLISSSNSKSFQIQDATGGFTVFGTNLVIDGLLASNGGLQAGDTITITGYTSCFNSLFELVTGTAAMTVNSKDGAPGVPLPKLVTPADLADGTTTGEGYESELVTLQNVRFVNPSGSFAGGTNYTVSADGTTTAPVVVVRITTANLNMVGQPVPTGPVDITGVLGQFQSGGNCTSTNTGYQLQPRSALDILTPGSMAASGSASPNPAQAGGTVTFTVQVVPASNPPSTGVVVNADLSPIGGPNPAAFTETSPGSGNFTYSLALQCNAPTGAKSLTVQVADAQARSASCAIPATVQAGVAAITVQPSNNIVCAGGTAQFTVVATGTGLTYRWYNASGPLNDGGNISGSTLPDLQISIVSQADADAGPYYAVVTGTCPIPGDPPTFSVTSGTATLSLGTTATPEQKQVVISQVYGGGGASYWTNDYIELFNRGPSAVSLDGWSVQFASPELLTGGQPGFAAPPRITVLSGTILPGHYFLIQEAQGAAGTHALPQPPDFDGTTQGGGIDIETAGGKVALVNNAAPLGGACPLGNCGVVDFLGWDALYTTCFEGSGAAPFTAATSAVLRKSACTDTNDNLADFTFGSVLANSPARPHTSADNIVPTVVTPPSDQVVCEGGTATFTVVADGPCLTYQWQVNNAGNWDNVTDGTGGETASYTTAAIAAADDGKQLRVQLSSPYGPDAFSTAAVLRISPANATDRQIVINQVYGGGGNLGATYQNDFIELYNKGTTNVDVTGWSVQYASAAGTSWAATSLTGVIKPGEFYLIQEAEGNSCTGNTPCGDPLPVSPNAVGTIAMAAAAGKVALVKVSTALPTAACPDDCRIVDLVGYGTTANCFEGTGPAPYPAADNTKSAMRSPVGMDTGDNSIDFAVGLVQPEHFAPGDFDQDGYVNGNDVSLFANCMSGPTVPATANCTSEDMDGDSDVDLRDFGLLQRCYSGTALASLTCLSGQ